MSDKEDDLVLVGPDDERVEAAPKICAHCGRGDRLKLEEMLGGYEKLVCTWCGHVAREGRV